MSEVSLLWSKVTGVCAGVQPVERVVRGGATQGGFVVVRSVAGHQCQRCAEQVVGAWGHGDRVMVGGGDDAGWLFLVVPEHEVIEVR